MRWAVCLVAFTLLADEAPPSIVFIGDPHLNQQAATPADWIAQTNWIASNQATWNIQAVLCAGDFWSTYLTSSWTNGWSTIDGLGLPYLSAVGNHDYENQIGAQFSFIDRSTTNFDAQIGYTRINGKSWFGGEWGGDATTKANQYILFNVGATPFLVLALEFYPRPAVMTWASSVVMAHLDRQVIVITHAYLNDGSTGNPNGLIERGDQYGPLYYSMPSDSYAGVQMEAWARGFPNNVHLIICGHNYPPDFTQRLDHRTYGVRSDYQDASPPSQVVTMFTFNGATITYTNINTTTGVTDHTTFPPVTLEWPPPALAQQSMAGRIR